MEVKSLNSNGLFKRSTLKYFLWLQNSIEITSENLYEVFEILDALFGDTQIDRGLGKILLLRKTTIMIGDHIVIFHDDEGDLKSVSVYRNFAFWEKISL